MYRSALRTTSRALRASRPAVGPVQRRFASTAARKGTWKGAAVRWGAACGALYWYNTSPLFAEELIPSTIAAPPHFSEHDNVTVHAVVAEKRRQAEARAAAAQPTPATTPSAPSTAPAPVEDGDATAKSPSELEEEAGQQGAFNPETGEINWDCPCLGGMAHGPCGDEFKAAFSCFVYSTEEPKGMDCIEKFQHMQDCFRKYPEIYAPELAEDEEAEVEAQAAAAAMEGTAPPPGEAGEGVGAQAAEAATLKANSPAPLEAAGQKNSRAETPLPSAPAVPAFEADSSSFEAPIEEARLDEKETDRAVTSVAGVEADNTPKEAYDATAANKNKETAKKLKPVTTSS